MATARISQAWQDEMTAMIDAVNPSSVEQSIGRRFSEYTSTNNLAIQFIVMKLAKKNISFQIINLGAGVKKVTLDTNICKKCNGTGRC